MRILTIDPGNKQSAYVLIDYDTYRPIAFKKADNAEIVDDIVKGNAFDNVLVGFDGAVIEMVACYGMAVGREVFDTCIWIGRFMQLIATKTGKSPDTIERKAVKLGLCGTVKAKDGNIIQALKDRFGDKGTKREPGFFFGFHADVWQAYALGVTYIDMLKEQERKQKQ